MRNKLLIACAVLFLIIIAGYLFIRFNYLKTKDFKPDSSKEKSILDISPSIVAKLQQLVKDGSNGLYILSVEKIDPHLLSSKLDAFNASIRIDSLAMHHLDSLHLLPDDIFTFHFSKLHINGIGIDDLLNKDRIEVNSIFITDPLVNVYHKKRPYNATERKQSDTLSLYEMIKGQMKKIAIGNIEIVNGTFNNIDLSKNKSSKYKAVSVSINDLLIDSGTRNDKSRFLFAKNAKFSTSNYSIATADSLYYFKAGHIYIEGERHLITAENVTLQSRYNRQQFESKLHFGKDMYNLALPKVTLKNVDWQALINNEKIISDEAEITGGSFAIFYDRSKPQGPFILDNFPQQALMKLPFPLFIKKFNIRHVNLSYEEHNPLSDKNGTVYFDNMMAEINNISNINGEIKKQPYVTIIANTLFMHHVPMLINFKFDLLKYRTGEFTAVIKIDSLDNNTINTIAEPLGMFSVKKGVMRKAVANVQGNNFRTTGNITMFYSGLHITPLKKDDDGNLTKKTVTNILANLILIKNENPKGTELRNPDFMVERGSHKNFFNLLWTSILTGIVKTVGIPTKFVRK